jgi:hypothetical protein
MKKEIIFFFFATGSRKTGSVEGLIAKASWFASILAKTGKKELDQYGWESG